MYAELNLRIQAAPDYADKYIILFNALTSLSDMKAIHFVHPHSTPNSLQSCVDSCESKVSSSYAYVFSLSFSPSPSPPATFSSPFDPHDDCISYSSTKSSRSSSVTSSLKSELPFRCDLDGVEEAEKSRSWVEIWRRREETGVVMMVVVSKAALDGVGVVFGAGGDWRKG